jgi:glycosyltransferase involved in cell wall biosynthesis
VALARLGHNVHVLSRAADQGPEMQTVCDEGVMVHRMQPPGFEFPVYGRSTYLLGYSWHVLRQLEALSQEVRFDVIDFPEFGAEGFAYQLDRTVWNWSAVVVQLHGPSAMFVEHIRWPEPGSRFQRYAMFAEELSIQRADGLMACSRIIADITSRAHGVDRESIDVVHCGVDARRFHPAETPEPKADRPTVLFVGNIVENKGIHTVVDAVLRLRAKYPAIHLQVLGKIPADSDLMQGFLASIEAAGATRNFEFVGHVDADALPEYYQRAHVFCSPAEFEGGVANVYLEAMACGCPVVASTAGGGPEAVTDGETGRLVPPNDITATVSAIDQLLGDSVARRRMRIAARRRVDEYFAMDRYIERVLNVYEKAIERSNRHPERWEDVRE